MKPKEIKNLNVQDRKKKIQELKLELIKARVTAEKGGKGKIREIKKTLARLKSVPLNNK